MEVGQVKTYSTKFRSFELGQMETGKIQPWQGYGRNDSDDDIDIPPVHQPITIWLLLARETNAGCTRYPPNIFHLLSSKYGVPGIPPNKLRQLPSKLHQVPSKYTIGGTLQIYYTRYPPNCTKYPLNCKYSTDARAILFGAMQLSERQVQWNSCKFCKYNTHIINTNTKRKIQTQHTQCKYMRMAAIAMSQRRVRSELHQKCESGRWRRLWTTHCLFSCASSDMHL